MQAVPNLVSAIRIIDPFNLISINDYCKVKINTLMYFTKQYCQLNYRNKPVGCHEQRAKHFVARQKWLKKLPGGGLKTKIRQTVKKNSTKQEKKTYLEIILLLYTQKLQNTKHEQSREEKNVHLNTKSWFLYFVQKATQTFQAWQKLQKEVKNNGTK